MKKTRQTNPFLRTDTFPAFGKMTPKAADQAMARLLKQAQKAVAALEKTAQPSWSAFIEPLDEASRPLGRAWGYVHHFCSVMNSPAWRKVRDKYQSQMVLFSLQIAQNKVFYKLATKLARRDDTTHELTAVRRRILDKMIRNFVDAGVGLDSRKRRRFIALEQRLAKCSSDFSNHVLDAIKGFSLSLTERSEVEGLPESLLATMAQTAGGTAKRGPWKVTLDRAVSVPFMQYSRNAAAREKIFRAQAALASTGAHDNTELIEEILKTKRELAALVGYRNYGEWSLASKTAKSVSAVESMLTRLAEASLPAAARERQELHAFAEAFGEPLRAMRPTPWNNAYWVEKLCAVRQGFDDEAVSKYFTFSRVLSGLFALAQRLFGVEIVEKTGSVSVWHPDVRFFEVRNAGESAPLAYFYLDPYSRPATKRSGAWMNDFACRRRRTDGTLELPIAVLVCNQTVPVGKKPPIMRFDEVETLFHEFGHALQHMLTTVEDESASGINGIEWDAVEVASQFMENWCYDPLTLRTISRHVVTGERIPDDLITKIRSLRRFRAASAMMRQLAFAKVDLDLHTRYPQPQWNNANALWQDVCRDYALPPTVPEARFLCAFSHIFAGGYAAGYYSYKWSEIISADAFAAFEEEGLDNEAAMRDTGRRYRNTILSLGGGTDPLEVFRRFRGRDPQPQALLRHSGIR